MASKKISLMFSCSHFKNMQLSKIDRLLNTSLSKPTIICAKITARCNSHCKQCDMWKRKSRVNELSAGQWKRAISKLKNWIGPFCLNIYGGEPFLRADLFEIIDFAHSRNVFTDVITNGFLLSDRLEELCSSNLSKLTVSLDGATEQTHDFLRGKGSFRRVIPAIKALRKRRKDLIITINTIMFRQNFNELPALARFVMDNQLNGIFFHILCWKGFKENYSKGLFLKNPLWPGENAKTGEVFDELIELKNSGAPIINSVKYLQLAREYFANQNMQLQKLTCLNPYQCLLMGADGNIMLCVRCLISGNILEDEPSAIWKSDKFRNLRKELLGCKEPCMLKDSFFEDTIASKISRARIALFKK